jgi:signal transduction histidine kinase
VRTAALPEREKAGAVGEALARILVERLRFTSVIVAGTTLLYALLDVVFDQPYRRALHAIEAMTILLAAATASILRFPRLLPYATALAVALAGVLLGVIAAGSLLRGEALAGSMLIVITVLVAAAVLPLGRNAQAVVVAMALAWIALIVRSEPETFRLLVRDPASVVALGLGLGVSLLLAEQHRRFRVAMLLEQRRQLALQAEISAMNAVLEGRVIERTAELEAAVEDLASFGYSISHDLRQPLRSIASFAQILADSAAGRLDAEETDHLQRVHGAARRMNGLLDEFLRLSRMVSRPMRRETVDLGAVFAGIAAELDRRDPQRSVEWNVCGDLAAEGDRDLLTALLHELAENAWKFTAGCEPARVTFGAEPARDGMRTFFLRDNGCGFASTRDRDVFKLFSRAIDGSTEDGFGTGLAVAERIVRRHGGVIRAESQPEEGATFFFSLPASS